MVFTEEQIHNKALTDKLTAFNPQRKTRVADGDVARGRPGTVQATEIDMYEIREDGSIVFRILAKNAKKVEIVVFGGPTLSLSKNENNVWECIKPYDPAFAGFQILNCYIDDMLFINQYLPIAYFTNKVVNYIDIPDPETPYVMLRDVPHGSVTKEIYWSAAMGEYESCMVYTPAEYQTSGKKYSVLYLQHGAGENETCWVHQGRLPYIMDNLIADGKALPFVVVMNDGMIKAAGETEIDSFNGLEGAVTEDCRKFIEGRYRVYSDKQHRAIAGLSLGSMFSSWAGFRHPELYSAVGLFSGFMRRRDNHNTYEDSPHLEIMKDSELFRKEYRMFFRSIGSDERMMHEFVQDDEFCAKYGADKVDTYRRIIYPGHDHVWNCWRRAFCDFAQLVFRWNEYPEKQTEESED